MILYLIPARGGSKRLPGKNLRKLAGIPLVAWAIRRAQGAARIANAIQQRVVVSTDDAAIAKVATEWGARVLMRPDIYSTDEATSEAVALHALATYADPIDLVVLVQPCSPFASAQDVAEVVKMAAYPPIGRHGVVSTRVGYPTGGAYALTPEALTAGRKFWRNEGTVELPQRGAVHVDIDTEDDWHMAEALLAARPVAPFSIAGREIGPGHPCFVIAEAGINHGGDPEKAHALVDAAADAGADAVKFQTFQPDLLAEPGPHLDLLRSVHLQCCEYDALKTHAEARGLIFLSSPFDEQSADFLDSIGAPAFKIPSGEIINLPLLRHVASKGKPVILSTGMSTMREVAAAVDALAGVPLALLHCVSEYPQHSDDSNIRAMDWLRQAFGVPVGWSDHTRTEIASHAAVARGASIVERHIMLWKHGDKQVDWEVSLGEGQFKSFVNEVRRVEAALGTGEKVPTPGELETAKVARRRDGLRRNA